MKILFIGAHPDDAEIRAGGLMLKNRAAGGRSKIISLTNGNCGVVGKTGALAAAVRKEEMQRVKDLYGFDYEIFDNNDGELTADLATRKRLVKSIRLFRPDLIVTHRPVDYHADHRYTSLLVQDASYLLGVKNFCSDVAALDYRPMIFYAFDNFKPDFVPHIFIDIDDIVHEKFRLLSQHASQVYGFMPQYNKTAEDMPQGEEARLKWLEGELDLDYVRTVGVNEARIPQGLNNEAVRAVKYEASVKKVFGAKKPLFVEAFSLCEYSRTLTKEDFTSFRFAEI